MKNIVAIVLAAGEGTRMVSSIPKVLHKICGKPMLMHVIDAIKSVGIHDVYVITGFQEPEIKELLGSEAKTINQQKRQGTAHAVMQAMPELEGFTGDVLVMCGDTPLIRPETIKTIVKRRRSHHVACTVLTTKLDDPFGYGRIVRNRDQTVRKIVEEKDTNVYEAEIDEINTGTYCFNAKDLFEVLPNVSNENAQNEYYLTDCIDHFYKSGREVEAVITEEPAETVGVNSRKDLAVAERYMRERILNDIMRRGVTVLSPETTFVDKTAVIGRDTVIYPFSIIEGDSVIGPRCHIGPGAQIFNSKLGENVKVVRATVDHSNIPDGQEVEPFSVMKDSVCSDSKMDTLT